MSRKQPNVIWVLTDQQRAMLLSCNGDPNVNTPNIDRLADMGVNFTNAVSGYPLCCPFRGSMLTSRYPHDCVPGHEYQLPPQMPTIADAFNDSGYHTAYFGKWHLDGFHEREGRAAMHIVPPERRGHFAQWVGYENNNSQYDCWVHGGEGENAFHYRLPGYETDCLTDILIDYIGEREHNDQPFFAVMSVQPPHDPYIAPPQYAAKFNPQTLKMRPNVPPLPEIEDRARREYAGACAMVENMDHNMGRIMQKLREAGLADDTHIVYFSDHGDMHGSQGYFLKTHPYEESLRIPMIIGGASHYTGRTRVRDDHPLNHVDIAPTTLGLCGITPPDWMQGTDYSALRLGGEQPQYPDSAYIQKNIETPNGYGTQKAWRGIVTRDGWKYVCFDDMPWLLYNTKQDPYEFHNMATNSMFSPMRKQLGDRLRRWVEETGDDFTIPQL